MNEIKLYWLCLSLIISFSNVLSLECYSCQDQDGNKDKCTKTSKQCEQDQNVCYSSVIWRIPPYWTPRGNRIHFLTKDCSTLTKCQQKQREVKPLCIRDWYLDWQCHECCQGDLCNYYVVLGAPSLHTSYNVFLCLFAAILNYLLFS